MNRKARCPTCGQPCNVLYYQTKVVDARGISLKDSRGKAKVAWRTLQDWWVCVDHPGTPFREILRDDPQPPKPKRK